jgi:hypothetical protein
MDPISLWSSLFFNEINIEKKFWNKTYVYSKHSATAKPYVNFNWLIKFNEFWDDLGVYIIKMSMLVIVVRNYLYNLIARFSSKGYTSPNKLEDLDIHRAVTSLSKNLSWSCSTACRMFKKRLNEVKFS